jgi:hypothetical protein
VTEDSDSIQRLGPPDLSRRLFASPSDNRLHPPILVDYTGLAGAPALNPTDPHGPPPNLSRPRLQDNINLTSSALGPSMDVSVPTVIDNNVGKRPDLSRKECEQTSNGCQLCSAMLTFLQITMPSHKLRIGTPRPQVTLFR